MDKESKVTNIRPTREKELNVQIGANLATLRNRKKLKQSQVEKDLNLANHSVSKFERGDAYFTPNVIEMFSNYYEVPKWLLFEGVPEIKWYEIYDYGLFKLFEELPKEIKKIYVAMIIKDWQLIYPEKDLDSCLEGKILKFLQDFDRLSF